MAGYIVNVEVQPQKHANLGRMIGTGLNRLCFRRREASPVGRPVVVCDGASRKIVNHIDFQRLAQLGANPVDLGVQPSPLPEQAYILKVAGYKPKGPQPNTVSLPLHRRLALHVGALALSPVLSARDRRRMKSDPVDYFGNAKWGPNRLLGRLVLEKSQRPY